MSSEKVFVVVEAIDRPAGAMLIRYQIVERIEPDPEESRIQEQEAENALNDIPEDVREDFKAQIAATKSMMGVSKKPITYRTEEKVAVCTKTEEIAAAIIEAKEQYDEIRKLKKSGAHFEFSAAGLNRF
jgi:hypothetical protein